MKPPSRSFLLFAVVFIVVSLGTAWLVVSVPGYLNALRVPFSDKVAEVLIFGFKFLACLGTGLAAALFATRRPAVVARIAPEPRAFRFLLYLTRSLEALLLVTYVATWVFAVPAVVSHLDAQVIDRYKAVVERTTPDRAESLSHYPRTSTLLAFPVAPCFILTYHVYMVAPLYGAGLIQVHFWCFTEPYEVSTVIVWLS
jgi:hypothetical protein